MTDTRKFKTVTPLHIVIYSKNNCRACQMNKRFIAEHNIEYVDNYYGNPDEPNYLDLESTDPNRQQWSWDKLSKIKSKYNVSQMPLVKVVDEEGNLMDYWSGFRPNKIREWFSEGVD